MNRRRLIGIGIIATLVIAGIAAVMLSGNAEGVRQTITARLDSVTASSNGALVVSGFIEADEVSLSPELGGRVVELPFAEGDEVAAGDVVVKLNTDLLLAQREGAEAQRQIAVAQRDLLKASPREEVVRQAQAQVAIAQASVDAASVSVADAAAIANDPQDIELQVVDAQTQLAVASQQLAAAQTQFTASGRAQENYYSAISFIEDKDGHINLPNGHSIKLWLPFDVILAPQHYQEASSNLQAAQDAVSGAQDLLGSLQSFAADPAGLRAQVASAAGQLATSKASLERAQAELAALKVGATEEDLAVANARIDEARAAVDGIDVLIDKMTISAPLGGVLLEQSVHVGELAVPGLPVITLANLDTVDLTVYLPEDQLNRVQLNQVVQVRVDSFPGKQFEGTVIHINSEAEFTPQGVQTREERVNLVYAVKIRIDNPDHDLKPGMPADASFE